VAKSEKIDFTESVGDYIEQRENLKHVFVLIDSRLTPQRIDIDFTSWLATCSVPFSLVFTKTDKQSPAKTRITIDTFLATMTADLATASTVLTSSSKTGTGRIDVLKVIEHHLMA
jgi:GTP-binding protein